MDEIKVNLQNLSGAEREELMRLIGNANKKEAWKPKYDETYYAVEGDGRVYAMMCNATKFDDRRVMINNCFETKKEAEWMVEHLKVKAALKRYADEHNESFGSKKVYIWWNGFKEKVDAYTENTPSITADQIYFSSEEIAKNAIKEIGEERLKKYYFGV